MELVIISPNKEDCIKVARIYRKKKPDSEMHPHATTTKNKWKDQDWRTPDEIEERSM